MPAQYEIRHTTQTKCTLGVFPTLKAAQQHLARLRADQRRNFTIVMVHR